MKRSFLIITGCLIFLAGMPAVFASTPITGTAYGKNIGLIHMDYATALRPEGFSGQQRDFYMAPDDPEFSGPGLPDFTAQIYDLADDEGEKCHDSSCLITGFIWSDAIGWIILNGEPIQYAFPDPAAFPQTDFARVNYNGAFSGYIWSENAGWIRLASSDSGTTTPAPDQTVTDWGVFFDPASEIITDEGSEEGDIRTLGRKLHGYAWSETLGWIKFGPDPGDSQPFGAYTSWIPDTSPPQFFIENNVWLLNSNENGAISWPDIAIDPESGIREDSSFTVERDSSPDFVNCNEPIAVSASLADRNLSLTIPSIGLIKNTALGYCKYSLTGKIFNNAGLDFQIGGTPPPGASNLNYIPERTFYVRAGKIDELKSKVLPVATTAVADGSQVISYILELADLAGNPVVPINCADCPKRQIKAQAECLNQMRYDSTQLLDSSPLLVNGIFQSEHGEILAPEPGIWPLAEKYTLEFSSFAPTVKFNRLDFVNFEVEFSEDELPKISTNASHTPAFSSTNEFSNSESAQRLTFVPGLLALNGHVLTGATQNTLINGMEASFLFQVKNQSASEIMDGFDIDTVFEFDPPLPETTAIEPVSGSDGIPGWSDPDVLDGAHMELAEGMLPNGFAFDGTTTIFRNAYPILSELNADGSYQVNPDYGIPGNRIDRSDLLSLSLGANALSDPLNIRFTPALLISSPTLNLDGINLSLRQMLAYRYAGQPDFTIYEPEPLVSGVNLQSAAGAKFKGIGVGETIFNGNLDVIGPAGVKGLSEQMRRNVAALTLGLLPCPASDPQYTPFEDSGDHLTLKTSGSCIKIDDKNKTIIAFYSGAQDQSLELGDGSEKTLIVPNGYRYSLIIRGGLNLFIKNNIAYEPGDALSSLGFILLKEKGAGANVMISPNPTNIVGQVFAEGSLLSSPDGQAFYYGGALGQQELKNQLYWQGSIASVNTLGGAGLKIVPEDISCNGISSFQCAQLYDLNFIRRFSVSDDGSSIINNGLFSGGGSCHLAETENICSLGLLPTAISLTPEFKIDLSGSESVDAFYIEPLYRPAPPGFSVISEQKSVEVIR